MLPVGTLWSLRAECPGFWSAPEALFIEGATEVTLRLWPRATLTGSVTVDHRERTPEILNLRVSPAMDGRALRTGVHPPETTISCPISEGGWRCAVPAVPLDVRIRASGFVSHYVWNLRPKEGAESSLGVLELERGASLSGWVEAPPGKDGTGETAVALTPQTGPVNEARHGETQARALREPADDRGFFHFAGVSPGRYLLQARRGELQSAQIGVTVLSDQESVLREPLVLRPRVDVEIRLTPPTDPWGRAWSVKLREGGDFSPAAGAAHPVEATTSEGLFRVRGLPEGEATIRVADHRDTAFLVVSRPVDSTHDVLDLRIPLITLAGDVRLGDEPLSARLWFGTRRGAVAIPVVTDENGEITGFLPREGPWIVELEGTDRSSIRRTLEVDVDANEAGEATLRVELPDTVFEGTVVTELGEPIEGALVSPVFVGPDPEPVPSAFTDSLGGFRFEGLPSGPVFVEGQTRDLSTGRVLALIANGGRSSPVRLVARPIRTVRGQVIGPHGPVAGAQVTLQSIGRRLNPTGELAVTDGEGRFEMRMSHGVRELLVGVFAPGFAARTYRTFLEEDSLIIPVDSLGGDLVFTSGLEEAGGSAWSDRTLFVLHRGGHVLWTRLFRWSVLHQGRPEQDGTLRVPMLEPGEYTACLGTYHEMERALLGGPLPKRCASGILQPHGELALAIPPKA